VTDFARSDSQEGGGIVLTILTDSGPNSLVEQLQQERRLKISATLPCSTRSSGKARSWTVRTHHRPVPFRDWRKTSQIARRCTLSGISEQKSLPNLRRQPGLWSVRKGIPVKQCNVRGRICDECEHSLWNRVNNSMRRSRNSTTSGRCFRFSLQCGAYYSYRGSRAATL